MTDLNKNIKTLELNKILDLAAKKAVSDEAKKRALSLEPYTSKSGAVHALNQVSAARNLMRRQGSPSLFAVVNVKTALSRANLGGLLSMRELLNVAHLLKAARFLKEYGGKNEDGLDFCIRKLFISLAGNKYLEEKISTSILSEDEVADSASSELLSIRRKIKATEEGIRDKLQKIISSPAYSKALQEPIITMRSDRFVIPLKLEYKGTIEGLVHDVSASGSTLFIEPMVCVKANNSIRELRAEEKKEIERILYELSAFCADSEESINSDFEFVTELDFIFAKAKLGDDMNAVTPEISEKSVKLIGARHPLISKDKVVPIDINIGGEINTLVITGPNTGGKTVALKTLGLLCQMAACGLQIPVCEGSSVILFDSVFADIGDEQSIEQSLSTFSSHMKNIVSILELCNENSLVLLDELGAGTDPVEGAALAVSIIEYIRSRGALLAATTHYSELKIYAINTAGVINAACEFDVQTLLPTYRLLWGVPGKSNAFAISKKLGIPEEIISDARSRISEEGSEFEDTVMRLDVLRQKLESELSSAEIIKQEAKQKLKDADIAKTKLEEKLLNAQELAKYEAEEIIKRARKTAEEAFAEIDILRKKAVSENSDYQTENEARTKIRRSFNEAQEQLIFDDAGNVSDEHENTEINVGDTVSVIKMGITAVVDSIGKDGKLVLTSGLVHMTADRADVILSKKTSLREKKISSEPSVTLRKVSVPSEIDLRGQNVIDAISELERYIDTASLGKLKSVRIIHGKGTGALRDAVRTALKHNKLVSKYRLGVFGEGETGVTIVELK